MRSEGRARRAARLVAGWHVPLALIAAALCLGAGVSLPILVVREFVFFGRKISLIGGVGALIGDGDWPLAVLLALFSIALPVIKIAVLFALWWRARRQRGPPGPVLRLLEWSGRWAMLDVFVVALVIVELKAQALMDAHVAMAVYPFLAAIGLTAYAARAVARVEGAATVVR
jgi:paraquat-inducible protein A